MSKTPQGEAPIEVVEYDPRWPSKFEMERVLLQSVLAPWLAGPIEHVGSTAVPAIFVERVLRSRGSGGSSANRQSKITNP